MSFLELGFGFQCISLSLWNWVSCGEMLHLRHSSRHVTVPFLPRNLLINISISIISTTLTHRHPRGSADARCNNAGTPGSLRECRWISRPRRVNCRSSGSQPCQLLISRLSGLTIVLDHVFAFCSSLAVFLSVFISNSTITMPSQFDVDLVLKNISEQDKIALLSGTFKCETQQ